MKKFLHSFFYLSIIILITNISISCESIEGMIIPKEEREMIIEAPELKNMPKEISQEGKIIRVNRNKIVTKAPNDIAFYTKGYFRWPFRIIPAINNTRETLYIDYNNLVTKTRLTYDEYTEHYYKINSEKSAIEPDDEAPTEWHITHIKIDGPDNYAFDIIGPARALFFTTQSYFVSSGYNTDMLPIDFTSFFLDGKQYHVTIAKFPVQLPIFTIGTPEQLATYKEDEIECQRHSLAVLFNTNQQTYLIQDNEGSIYAAFDDSNYKIYKQGNINPDDFIPAIGVYSEIIEKLKIYYSQDD